MEQEESAACNLRAMKGNVLLETLLALSVLMLSLGGYFHFERTLRAQIAYAKKAYLEKEELKTKQKLTELSFRQDKLFDGCTKEHVLENLDYAHCKEEGEEFVVANF